MLLNANLQTAAYLVALIELIIGLYIFILDYRSNAYRLVSAALVTISANTFAFGYLIEAGAAAALIPLTILAGTTPLIVAMLLISSAALLRPDIVRSMWGRRALAAVAILGALPAALTLLDAFTGSQLWLTKPAGGYAGGLIEKAAYTGGTLGPLLNGLIYGGIGAALLAFLVYVLAAGSPALKRGRLIGGLLLAANLAAAAPNPLRLPSQQTILLNLAASAGYLTAFTIAAFEHNQERRGARGSLQTRLTLVSLVIALPLMAAMGIMLTERAQAALEKDAAASLASVNQNVIDAAEIWLASTARSLRTLTATDSVRSMDPEQQSQALRSLTSIYPDIFLASTTDLNGDNVARSDARPPANYSDRDWFQETSSGLPLSYQVVFERSMGRPVLEMAMPIRDAADRVIGVAMFVTQLNQIERLVKQETSTAGATVLIINNDNQLVAASENKAALLLNLGPTVPVRALRSGVHGPFRYTDNAGSRWIANINILSNGWGVIVQETEAELFAPIRSFRRLSLSLLGVGALILLWLTWSTIRQAMQPVRQLTADAAAITAGDLSRVTPVYGQDELGVLAESFNTMTAQLRDLISGLEGRVAARTRDVERRAVQLQTTADVAREAAAIHDPDRLLTDVAEMISNRFGFYHAGIFLLETAAVASGGKTELRPFAVLRAASSEGGQRMLERGHRLAVGSTRGTGQGIVGYVAATGKSRIALDVGSDAVFFNNPDLPMTRSEMALPLKLGEQVIGVLDVQSRKPSAFSVEDEAILQTLADQLAVAIENARLIDESRQALQELEALYGRQVQQGWQKRLRNQPLTYRLEAGRVVAAAAAADAGPIPAEAEATAREAHLLEAPIDLRGVRLGSLRLRRRSEDGPWSQADLELAREATAQIAQALENARLLEEIQERAAREEAINRITSSIARSFDLEGVLRVAALELGKLPAVHEAAILVGSPKVEEAAESGSPEDQHNGGGNGHRA